MVEYNNLSVQLVVVTSNTDVKKPQKSRSERVFDILNYSVLSCFAFITFFPCWYVFEVFIVIASTLPHLLITAVTAYPLSRKQLRGKKVILLFALITLHLVEANPVLFGDQRSQTFWIMF